MIIMLFGVSNVGKTVTGQKLAKKLECSFIDLDEEIKKRFNLTLEKFMHHYPFSEERGKIKYEIMLDLISKKKKNTVIAVSPIFHSRYINPFLEIEKVIAIELQDSEENIFNRMVFSDENDNIYEDDEYKNRHREYYIKDIHEDIIYFKNTFKQIKSKYFIDNHPVEKVVDDLMIMIRNIKSV